MLRCESLSTIEEAEVDRFALAFVDLKRRRTEGFLLYLMSNSWPLAVVVVEEATVAAIVETVVEEVVEEMVEEVVAVVEAVVVVEVVVVAEEATAAVEAVLHGGCHHRDIFIRDCRKQSRVIAWVYVTKIKHTQRELYFGDCLLSRRAKSLVFITNETHKHTQVVLRS